MDYYTLSQCTPIYLERPPTDATPSPSVPCVPERPQASLSVPERPLASPSLPSDVMRRAAQYTR
jgi:hypothetical protein